VNHCDVGVDIWVCSYGRLMTVSGDLRTDTSWTNCRSLYVNLLGFGMSLMLKLRSIGRVSLPGSRTMVNQEWFGWLFS